MVVKAIRMVLLASVAFAVWFLYRLGHPKPEEPRFIYKFRRHPSAIPEYLAYLARGLFHPHLLWTGSTEQEQADPLPGDELVPHPLWHETRAKTIDVPAEPCGRGSCRWGPVEGDGTGGRRARPFRNMLRMSTMPTESSGSSSP